MPSRAEMQWEEATRGSVLKSLDRVFTQHVWNDPSKISISGLKKNTKELSREFCEKMAQEFPKTETVESCLQNNYLKRYMNLTIAKWEVHPLYDAASSNFHGDVALFEIDQDTPGIPVAELCNREVTSGETVFATGYGKRTDLLDQTQAPAVVLKYAQLPVQEVFPEDGVFETAGRGGLLFDDPNGVSLLLGDSGSGVYAIEDGKKCLAGINSNGQRYPFHRFFYVHYHTDLTPSERFGIRQWLLPLLKSHSFQSIVSPSDLQKAPPKTEELRSPVSLTVAKERAVDPLETVDVISSTGALYLS